MKAVSVLTTGWIAGKTWIPDGLITVGIRIDAETIHTVLPISDQTNLLSLQINGIVPLRSMKHRSFEFIEPSNIGPCPIVKVSRGLDEDVTRVLEGLTRDRIFDSNNPLALFFTPASLGDYVTRFDVFV